MDFILSTYFFWDEILVFGIFWTEFWILGTNFLFLESKFGFGNKILVFGFGIFVGITKFWFLKHFLHEILFFGSENFIFGTKFYTFRDKIIKFYLNFGIEFANRKTLNPKTNATLNPKTIRTLITILISKTRNDNLQKQIRNLQIRNIIFCSKKHNFRQKINHNLL